MSNPEDLIQDNPLDYYQKDKEDFVTFDFPTSLDHLGEDSYSQATKELKIKELAQLYNVDDVNLLKKIDLWVTLPFMLLYFIAYFNRSSFGFIEISGIHKDFNISNLQFYSSYTAFFAPYILFQFFTNQILRFIRPHFWISISTFIFGVVTFASGFTHNFGSYVFLHFLHGVSQAGVETALFYIMGNYYTMKESQLRFSAVYSVSCLAGVLSNLIANGVGSNLDGDNNWVGWRWAVIIYGSMTMFIAIVLFFIIPDFPEGARFFSDDETYFLIKKLEVYNGKSGYGLETKPKDILKNLIDPLIYLPAIGSLGIYYSTYVYAFHEPQIITAIDFHGDKNISYGSYPWILAFFWTNICGYLSQKFNKRFLFIFINLILAIIGSILIFAPNDNDRIARYIGCFFIVSGGYSALPILLCWATMNVGGHLRKSIMTSIHVSIGSCGGLMALMIFYKQETSLRVPFYLSLALLIVTAGISGIYSVICNKVNKAKRTEDYKLRFQDQTEKSKIMYSDKSPYFEYIL